MELGWLNIIGIALGLAMDALAVAVATGMSLPKVTHRHVFRQAFHFGLFQFLMPVLGWLAGTTISARVGAWNNWIAFALLMLVGGKMLWEAMHARGAHRADPTRGWRLIMLSIATSLDSFAVGMSTGFLGVSIWVPSMVIGVVAGLLTAAGIMLGGRVGPRFGRVADLAGGLILIAIGLRLVV